MSCAPRSRWSNAARCGACSSNSALSIHVRNPFVAITILPFLVDRTLFLVRIFIVARRPAAWRPSQCRGEVDAPTASANDFIGLDAFLLADKFFGGITIQSLWG
jgi:hypothetical protein